MVDSLAHVVRALVDRPGDFADAFITGAREGFEEDFQDFPTRQLRGVFDWLLEGLDLGNLSLPSSLEGDDLLRFVLQLFGLGGTGLQELLGAATPAARATASPRGSTQLNSSALEYLGVNLADPLANLAGLRGLINQFNAVNPGGAAFLVRGAGTRVVEG